MKKQIKKKVKVVKPKSKVVTLKEKKKAYLKAIELGKQMLKENPIGKASPKISKKLDDEITKFENSKEFKAIDEEFHRLMLQKPKSIKFRLMGEIYE